MPKYDIKLFDDPQFVLRHRGPGRLRITERWLVNRLMGSFMLLVVCFGISFDRAVLVQKPTMFDGFFWAMMLLASVVIYYLLRPGYIEFDNLRETVTIKRFHRKFLPARVVPYQDINRVQLGLNENVSQHGTAFTKSLFKLHLKDGSEVRMCNVYSEKLGYKIRAWIDEHLKFETVITHRKLKKRKALFSFKNKPE